MPHFCSQCGNRINKEADINLFLMAVSLQNGRSISFICEGCNNRAIFKDDNGNLYLAKYVNNEISLFPVNISEIVPVAPKSPPTEWR
jgi:hypothetical protein